MVGVCIHTDGHQQSARRCVYMLIAIIANCLCVYSNDDFHFCLAIPDSNDNT